jgi:hypothetical protein
MTQVEAADAHAAIRKWSVGVTDADLKSWRLDRQTALGISEDPPIRINGLRNAWCASTTSGRHLLLLNIVATLI